MENGLVDQSNVMETVFHVVAIQCNWIDDDKPPSAVSALCSCQGKKHIIRSPKRYNHSRNNNVAVSPNIHRTYLRL